VSAAGGSALFLVLGAACCVVIASKSAVPDPRAINTDKSRTGTSFWKHKNINKMDGDALSGPLRPGNVHQAERTSTGFSFKGMTARYNPVVVQQGALAPL
tara:strand:- start:759 stop:1058 length:300 start_codon:yes stop_codon:yes gene_type:complete